MEIDSKIKPRTTVLCILDGWGERLERENNAIALGHTPNWDRFIRAFPNASLEASSGKVGLPDGQMGNSEVGHMSLGSGRVVLQNLPRIDSAIRNKSFLSNERLMLFINKLKRSNGSCHLMGLLSPGGVHSHQNHLVELAKVVSGSKIPLHIHLFMDGRDAPPTEGLHFLEDFISQIRTLKNCQISSIGGRYWAMDRDCRWKRVKQAYDSIVLGEGVFAQHALAAIKTGYNKGNTDEFLIPTVLGNYNGMVDGDGLLMGNFRSDRVRQILTALVDPAFDEFERKRICNFSTQLGMVEYSSHLNQWFSAIFPSAQVEKTLGQVVSEAGKKQLRIAETEKYPHVTFFLNGGSEKKFNGEERILIASPKVATYDLQPEMSAPQITDKLIETILSGAFDLIVVNYANGDMVGHTGKLEAAKLAVGSIDLCLGQLERALIDSGSTMLITADHGNCEVMHDHVTKNVHTQHTLNKVPIVLVNPPAWVKDLKSGSLCDVAPTVLQLLELPKPSEMTGVSLID